MEGTTSEKWARLRFAIVGPLLVSPPPEGGLKAELENLSRRSWDHPSGTGQVRFAASTIERWYYEARAKQNPVAALGRKTRSDKGRERALSPALIEALRGQHRAHPSWSAQLHWDNLAVLVAADPSLGPMPSYATLVRAMRRRGLTRKRRSKWFEDADPRPEPREVLSYEVSRSHAMWHGLCCGQCYVAVRLHCVCRQEIASRGRNIIRNGYMALRKAMSPLSSFQGRCGPASAASQRARALAFISRSISA